MNKSLLCLSGLAIFSCSGRLQHSNQAAIEALCREVAALKNQVEELNRSGIRMERELEVDRLVVRKELLVSDTGAPWEEGFEAHQIPRGLYARSLWDGPGGLWVRSRLIKGEIDDPFDDRFHALERDGSVRRAPGHISWNVWMGGAWRQMAIVQGEGVDITESPPEMWHAGNHPGQLRIQSFRPGHDEPLTDALIGQGKMSLGGGGYGGDGLPHPQEVLEVWGGEVRSHPVTTPEAPVVITDDGSGAHAYALIAVGSQGARSAPSSPAAASGLATLQWNRDAGADAYVILRDGIEVTGPVRMEGTIKRWTDKPQKDFTPQAVP